VVEAHRIFDAAAVEPVPIRASRYASPSAASTFGWVRPATRYRGLPGRSVSDPIALDHPLDTLARAEQAPGQQRRPTAPYYGTFVGMVAPCGIVVTCGGRRRSRGVAVGWPPPTSRSADRLAPRPPRGPNAGVVSGPLRTVWAITIDGTRSPSRMSTTSSPYTHLRRDCRTHAG